MLLAQRALGSAPRWLQSLNGHAIQARTSSRLFHSAIYCTTGDSVTEDKLLPPPKPRQITKGDVVIQFARSSGAGGQNVNKVNTKVDMRLHLDSAAWIAEEVREAVKIREKNRMNKEGELVITSQRTRKQGDNLEDALQKLQEIIDTAWESVLPIEEDPEKKKKLEKQKERGKEKRLEDKKKKSDKKKDRRAKIDW